MARYSTKEKTGRFTIEHDNGDGTVDRHTYERTGNQQIGYRVSMKMGEYNIKKNKDG